MTEELKSDPNEVKQITEELKVVPTNEEMLVIGSSFVKTKILDPLYKMFNSNTCRSIAFSNRDRGFIDCWYPLMSSLQSNDYQKMQAELINWHLESYLEARDKRLGNDKWKGLTQYFFWTNLRTKVTSLVKKDIWDFLDTIRKKCLHIRENELTKHKIYKFECVTPETIQLPKGLTEHLIEKNLEADNVWISIGDGTHAYMARLSDTTIQEWGLLLIDKKS